MCRRMDPPLDPPLGGPLGLPGSISVCGSVGFGLVVEQAVSQSRVLPFSGGREELGSGPSGSEPAAISTTSFPERPGGRRRLQQIKGNAKDDLDDCRAMRRRRPLPRSGGSHPWERENGETSVRRGFGEVSPSRHANPKHVSLTSAPPAPSSLPPDKAARHPTFRAGGHPDRGEHLSAPPRSRPLAPSPRRSQSRPSADGRRPSSSSPLTRGAR